MPDFQTLRYEVEDQILTLTMNRPERLNAFNSTMQREFLSALDEADADDGVRVVIELQHRPQDDVAGVDLRAGIFVAHGALLDWVLGSTGGLRPGRDSLMSARCACLERALLGADARHQRRCANLVTDLFRHFFEFIHLEIGAVQR